MVSQLRAARPAASQKRKAASAPGLRRTDQLFNVLIQRQALIETSVEVSARTKAEAEEKAVAAVKQEPFDLSKAILSVRVRPGSAAKAGRA